MGRSRGKRIVIEMHMPPACRAVCDWVGSYLVGMPVYVIYHAAPCYPLSYIHLQYSVHIELLDPDQNAPHVSHDKAEFCLVSYLWPVYECPRHSWFERGRSFSPGRMRLISAYQGSCNKFEEMRIDRLVSGQGSMPPFSFLACSY